VSTLATCLGHPRIGVARELKKALESYWADKTSAAELSRAAAELRARHWRAMQQKGIHHIPSNDFSLYDHVLDTAFAFGVIPARYRSLEDPLQRYFAMARGFGSEADRVTLPALEMTKWFDTNYHYLVPELEIGQRFTLDSSKMLAEIEQARQLGIETRPVLLGPVTFLLLSKLASAPASPGAHTLDSLEPLLTAYEALFAELAAKGVEWLQLDEPCLVLDLDQRAQAAAARAFARLSAASARPRV